MFFFVTIVLQVGSIHFSEYKKYLLKYFYFYKCVITMKEHHYFDLLNTILSSTRIGVWAYDWQQNQYTYYNDVLTEIHERPLSDFLHNPDLWTAVIHPDDREKEAVGTALALQGKPVELQYRIYSKNNHLKWICDRRKVVLDKSGKPTRSEGIVEDITSRKQLEELLLQSEHTYHYLFDNNPHPMWLLDTETFRFLAVNNAAIDQYGYSREEFLTMTTRDIRQEEARLEMEQDVKFTLTDVSEPNYRGIWRHLTKDGRILFVEIHSHAFVHQGKPARLTVAHNVTEKLKANQKIQLLHEELNHFRYAISMAFMLLVLDLEGSIVQANPNFLTRLGYQEPEVAGKSLRVFIPDFYPDYYFDGIKTKVATGEIWRDELRLKTSDGNICWTDTLVIPIRTDDGAINQSLVILNDLTHTKTQEAEIVHLLEKLMNREAELRTALNEALQLNQQLVFTKKRLKKAQKLASIGTWSWDIRQRKLFCSEELFDIVGLPDMDLTEGLDYQQFLNYVHPDDQKTVLQAHQYYLHRLDIEYRIIRADGQTRYVHELSVAERNENGRKVYYSGTVQDITHRKLIELQLTEQNKILEEIAYLSSHTLRRPVATILGLINLFDFNDLTNPFNAEVIVLLERATRELDDLLFNIVQKSQDKF